MRQDGFYTITQKITSFGREIHEDVLGAIYASTSKILKTKERMSRIMNQTVIILTKLLKRFRFVVLKLLMIERTKVMSKTMTR